MAIGGYLELELNKGEEYHKDAIRLNTGRSAFEYILRVKNSKKVYLPFYTCDVMYETAQRLKIDIEYYSIDESFNPIFNLDKINSNELFVYTNYFGICSEQVEYLSALSIPIIFDNAQSFYSKPIKKAIAFNSARKFFGVPDGAYLYTDEYLDCEIEQESAINRFNHLIRRIESSPEDGYDAFKKNDDSFKHGGIKKMSKISQKLLCSLDYDESRKIRRGNFSILNERLGFVNQLSIELSDSEVPLSYPYLTDEPGLREYLIGHKVFVPQYWPNVLKQTSVGSTEHVFAEKLMALPIDQRYGVNDMDHIVNLIINYGQR